MALLKPALLGPGWAGERGYEAEQRALDESGPRNSRSIKAAVFGKAKGV